VTPRDLDAMRANVEAYVQRGRAYRVQLERVG
jgi:hypothetical protein